MSVTATIAVEARLREMTDLLLYCPFDADLLDDTVGASPTTEAGGLLLDHDVMSAKIGAGAVLVAEATTNLVNNPSFENNVTDSWTFYDSGSGGSANKDTDVYKVGAASCRLDTGTAWIRLNGPSIVVADGAKVTLSGWVRANASATASDYLFRLYDNDTPAWVINLEATLVADTWTFLQGTWENTTGGAINVRVYCYKYATGPSSLYLDAIQVEIKGYPTPYCDGSLGTGHSWSGAAHNSTSSRVKCELKYDQGQSGTEGSFACWVAIPEIVNGANNMIMGWWDVWNTESMYIALDTAGNVDFNIFAGSVQQVGLTHAVTDWNPHEWHHVCVTWKANSCHLYIDGVLEASDTSCTMPTITSTSIGIGQNGSTTGQLSGWIDEPILSDFQLSEAEVGLLYDWAGYGNAVDGIWTPLTDDVLAVRGLTAEYGFRGHRPTDRVARVGKMTFFLDNSSLNEGAQQGWYSPTHASSRTGWDVSVPVRLKITYSATDYFKFLGKVQPIKPTAGTKRRRDVRVVCKDWIQDALKFKIKGMEILEDNRSDQIIAAVVAEMTEQPRATSYATGQETLPSALDDVRDGKTTAMSIFQRVAVSEFGYLMLIGDQAGGGTLKFQDRHERVKDTTVQLTFSENDIADLPVEHNPEMIFNIIKARVFPRDVGASAETIATLDSTLEIAAGETDSITLHYRDPNSEDVTVSGKDFWDPEGKNEIIESEYERGFEGGTTGWVASGSDTDTIAQSSTQAKSGTYSLKLTSGTGAAHTNKCNTGLMTGFAQNDVLYVQAYIYVPSAWPDGVAVYISEYDAGDVYKTFGYVEDGIRVTGSWYRVSGTYTISHADTAKILIGIGEPTNQDFSGGAVECYIDEVYIVHDSNLNFEFSSAEDGGGDLNTDLALIDSSITGSSAEFQFENTGTGAGFVTSLLVKGTIIRIYNPVERTAEDVTSQGEHGDRLYNLNLAYQADTRTGQDFADTTLSKYKDPTGWVKSITFHANRSDALMTGALDLEPGDRIKIVETVTGLNTEYFINGVRLRIYNKSFIDCTWYVTPGSTAQYWIMGTVGFSEIGETTWVGF